MDQYFDEDLCAMQIFKDWVISHDIPIIAGDDAIVTIHRERWLDLIIDMYMANIIKTRKTYFGL